MTHSLTLDPAELGDASNVLLVAPEVREPIEDLFAGLLGTIDPTPDHVVGVTMAKPPGDFRKPWRRSLAGHPVTFSFVSTAGSARSVAADASADQRPSTAATVTRLPEPRPLSTFQQSIAERIDEASSGQTVVCVHSLTHLLEYVDPETAFRFLHVLLSKVRTSDARGFFHIDGDIHDEETVVRLSTLFDVVVEFDRDDPNYQAHRTNGDSR